MDSIAQCLAIATRHLEGGDSPRLDAECLLAHTLAKSRSYLYTWPERQLSLEQQAEFQQLVARRAQGEPIAHLLGEKEFWGLRLKVNASTLIPRPETELLVETCLDRVSHSSATILDLGTGTGAIALALASERPNWAITGIDAFAEVIALAQVNLANLQFAKVEFLQSDWFAAVKGKCFHCIVSNPPYVAEADNNLRHGDVRFEPLTALVAGIDGLDAIRTIIETAPQYLEPSGWLIVEHGWDQGDPVRELLRAQKFHEVETLKDLAGLERISCGRIT